MVCKSQQNQGIVRVLFGVKSEKILFLKCSIRKVIYEEKLFLFGLWKCASRDLKSWDFFECVCAVVFWNKKWAELSDVRKAGRFFIFTRRLFLSVNRKLFILVYVWCYHITLIILNFCESFKPLYCTFAFPKYICQVWTTILICVPHQSSFRFNFTVRKPFFWLDNWIATSRFSLGFHFWSIWQIKLYYKLHKWTYKLRNENANSVYPQKYLIHIWEIPQGLWVCVSYRQQN